MEVYSLVNSISRESCTIQIIVWVNSGYYSLEASDLQSHRCKTGSKCQLSEGCIHVSDIKLYLVLLYDYMEVNTERINPPNAAVWLSQPWVNIVNSIISHRSCSSNTFNVNIVLKVLRVYSNV